MLATNWEKADDPVKEGGDGEEEALDPGTRELEVKSLILKESRVMTG